MVQTVHNMTTSAENIKVDIQLNKVEKNVDIYQNVAEKKLNVSICQINFVISHEGLSVYNYLCQVNIS